MEPNDLEDQYKSTVQSWRDAIAAVARAVAATRGLAASAWVTLGVLVGKAEELVGVGLSDLGEVLGLLTSGGGAP